MDFDSFHAENLERSKWTSVPSFNLSYLRNKLKEGDSSSSFVSQIVEDMEETYFTFLEGEKTLSNAPHEHTWVRCVLDVIKAEYPTLPLVV